MKFALHPSGYGIRRLKQALYDEHGLVIGRDVLSKLLKLWKLSLKRKIKLYRKYILKLKKIKCIHGHFLPSKYIDLKNNKNVVFVTWLRDPLERLGSHYNYWKRAYNEKTSAPLHKKVVEEDLVKEDFITLREGRFVLPVKSGRKVTNR